MHSNAEMRILFFPLHSLCLHFHPTFLDFCVFAVPRRSPPYSRHDRSAPHSQSLTASSATSEPDDSQTFISRPFSGGAAPDFRCPSTWTPGPRPPNDVGSSAPQYDHHTPHSEILSFVEQRQIPTLLPVMHTCTVPQRRPLRSDPLDHISSQYMPQPQQQNPGMFNQAHDFTVTGTLVDGNFTYNNISSDEFMEKLLKDTIPGAAYDSSAREPPPRCHAGTRLAILERCLYFIVNSDGTKKMRWIVGVAGVGKSAIMQTVAESPMLQVNYHASVFFSINGRSDGTKVINTISYQFAAKSEPYRRIIEREITRDPSLLQSSMAKQFTKFIIEPFIYYRLLQSTSRVLIIIDGLDECANTSTQLELLRLISDFCASYPSAPLVWLIASRPEPHITSFFSRAKVIPVHGKEEIQIDSDDARADVERFLRHELSEIKKGSDSLDPQWPDERDIWKLANAAGGLFAYVQTVVRYIGDSRVGSPVSQFSDVLDVIDMHPLTNLSGEEHPMAQLDALYARILSNVSSKIMVNTRKLLLALASGWDSALQYNHISDGNFIVLCNWLGMTADEAYAALNHLRSVLYVPRRDNAGKDRLSSFHKSFIDHIFDPIRSGFSPNIEEEARQLMAQCASRILKAAPNGVDQCLDVNDLLYRYGVLSLGFCTGSKISLSWSVDEASDTRTRLRVYQLAIGEVANQIKRGDIIVQSEFYVHLLTTQFSKRYDFFPHDEFRNWVFDEPQRSNFIKSGLLQEVPLKAFDTSGIVRYDQIKLRFRSPPTTGTTPTDPWCSSCKHERKGEWAKGKCQDWTTVFKCSFCCDRLEQQLDSWKTRYPEHTVLILLTSTNTHCVEVRCVDLGDGVSDWTYQFWFRQCLEMYN